MESVPAKHLLHRTRDGSWFGTDYTMNLYRGCCHGCIYCDSRSDCYRVEDFDTVRVKENALAVLRDDLRRKLRPGIVGMGAMSDPYNPFERELELTRNALSLLDAYGFGVTLATKSDLVVRDIDLLRFIQSRAPVLCKLTLTTADDALAAKLEPRAPSPTRRLEAVRALSRAGIPVCILLMPVLPFVEDTEENVLAVTEAAAEAGKSPSAIIKARSILKNLFFIGNLHKNREDASIRCIGMTQRQGQRSWYLDRLEAAFPGQGLREKHEKRYGDRYVCTSPRARRLWEVFSRRCGELGLLYEMRHITANYQRGYEDRQLSFLD